MICCFEIDVVGESSMDEAGSMAEYRHAFSFPS